MPHKGGKADSDIAVLNRPLHSLKRMRFSVLASGSSGNACYVETDQSKILVDAGLSGRELTRRLEIIGSNPENLDAILITHEHSDHMKGAGPLARRLDIPVYLNASTMKRGIRILGNISRPIPVHTGQMLTIRDICVETFTKCHDAVDPMGLVISSNGVKLGLATDLGRSTRLIEDRLKDCNALILEFNHDSRMLEEGPYPWELKQRVKGADGHLSNKQASELLETVSNDRLQIVILAHLSEANNLPEIAYKEAESVLKRCGLNHTRILIGRQDHPLPMEEL